MEAKDSKGNSIKVGDTAKVLRRWTLEEHHLSITSTHKDMIGQSFEIAQLTPNEGTACVNGFWTPLCVLEKVQATPKTFKVLIAGCSSPQYWYHKENVGGVFEVEGWEKDTFRILDTKHLLLKSDCHVIEPWYEVARKAEETGRSVEYWDDEWKQDTRQTAPWYPNCIYRLTPEPAQPEYEPYSYEDRDKLRGLWVHSKSGELRERVVISVHEGGVSLSGIETSYKKLFDQYETLDGQPVGKLKTT